MGGKGKKSAEKRENIKIPITVITARLPGVDMTEETAKNVLSMMESVVAEGTGKNSQVKGQMSFTEGKK